MHDGRAAGRRSLIEIKQSGAAAAPRAGRSRQRENGHGAITKVGN
jgi:hypothetical protein